MARRYSVRWVDYAAAQRDGLSRQARRDLEARLQELSRDPRHRASYDNQNAYWTATFGADGYGLIIYIIGDQTITITVLRVFSGK